MKKILYVWKGRYPWDVRAEKICNTFLKNGFEVFILARWIEGQAEFENYQGLNIIRAGFGKEYKWTQPVSFNPIWKKALKKVVEEIKPDLIMPRDIMLAELCGNVGRRHNIPVIMDMAEHYPAAMKGWKKYSETFIKRLLVHKLNIPELVERRAVGVMDGIVTVCEEQNLRLNHEFKFDINSIEVIHNTPEKNTFNEVTKKKITNARVFGHHGYLSAEKRIDKFLSAFVEVSNDNNLEFHIAGYGDCMEDLKKISSSSKNVNQIKYLGEYQFSDLPKILNEFDIGVLPYQISNFNNYTIHNKIFDYFALGIPVIVSETIPFKRLMKETKAGLVVDCENVENIKNLLFDIQSYDLQVMSENGRKAFEEKYNWDVDSANLLKFVKRYL